MTPAQPELFHTRRDFSIREQSRVRQKNINVLYTPDGTAALKRKMLGCQNVQIKTLHTSHDTKLHLLKKKQQVLAGYFEGSG